METVYKQKGNQMTKAYPSFQYTKANKNKIDYLHNNNPILKNNQKSNDEKEKINLFDHEIQNASKYLKKFSSKDKKSINKSSSQFKSNKSFSKLNHKSKRHFRTNSLNDKKFKKKINKNQNMNLLNSYQVESRYRDNGYYQEKSIKEIDQKNFMLYSTSIEFDLSNKELILSRDPKTLNQNYLYENNSNYLCKNHKRHQTMKDLTNSKDIYETLRNSGIFFPINLISEFFLKKNLQNQKKIIHKTNLKNSKKEINRKGNYLIF